MARQTAFHIITKRQPRDILINARPVDEIHRHVEHVIDPAFKAESIFKNKWQHATAIRIGVRPDLTTITQEPVRFAFNEGRRRKQRCRDRLQRHGDAHFLDHIRFGLKVQIDLHGAGPQHHVEP